MTIKSDGGQAFPWTERDGPVAVTCGGMTLRDWFAGQVAATIFSELHRSLREANAEVVNTHTITAKAAYELADAMLAEREREN